MPELENQEEEKLTTLDPVQEPEKEEQILLRNIPQGAGSKLDSDTVRGLVASNKASPNALLALDENGKFPSSALPEASPKVILQIASFETGAVAIGSAAIPFDDTIPQKTEGTQFMSLAITPKSSTSKLLIQVVINIEPFDPANHIMSALFKDSVSNAIASCFTTQTGQWGMQHAINHIFSSVSTAQITFKIRSGAAGAQTITFNGRTQLRKLGGTMASSIIITEFST